VGVWKSDTGGRKFACVACAGRDEPRFPYYQEKPSGKRAKKAKGRKLNGNPRKESKEKNCRCIVLASRRNKPLKLFETAHRQRKKKGLRIPRSQNMDGYRGLCRVRQGRTGALSHSGWKKLRPWQLEGSSKRSSSSPQEALPTQGGNESQSPASGRDKKRLTSDMRPGKLGRRPTKFSEKKKD